MRRIAQVSPLFESVPPELHGRTQRQRFDAARMARDYVEVYRGLE